MGDTGVAKQALEIRLRDGGQVSVDQGEGGQQNENEDQFILEGFQHEEGLEHPDQNDKSSGFRRHSEEGSNGRWRALIDIWNPELEWCGGNFEADGNQDHGQAKENRCVVRFGDDREIFLDGSEVGLTRHAENPGDAVDEESG